MWQSLFESLVNSLADRSFTVLAVALDEPEAARPWIEAAQPAYPCLIDRTHHVADLYNLVNVPQAVWIDEHGRIVRPPEIAGSNDGFRQVNRTTGVVPEAVLAERVRIKTQYMDAVRDWVLHGAASVNVLDAERAAARLKLPQDAASEAHARFRLGHAPAARGPGRRGRGAPGRRLAPQPRLVGDVAAGGAEGSSRAGVRAGVLGAGRCAW